MDRSLFEIARNETPEVRTEFLRKHLFKNNGSVPTDIPTSALKAEAEEESEQPREYGRRTINGKLPPAKFPPARTPRVITSPERQRKFDRFVMQDEPEAVTVVAPPDIPEKVFTAPPPEVPAVSVPIPSIPNESEDDMQKKKSATAAKATAPSEATKGSRGKAAHPLSAKVFDNLYAMHQKGEHPTHSEYQAKFGKVERNFFYTARTKLDRLTKAKKGPAGRGKPDHVFTPAPAAGGNGARIEILYTSETSPNKDIMEELKKILPVVLAAFSASAGIPIDVSELEIKNFAPAGYEIRRKVQ